MEKQLWDDLTIKFEKINIRQLAVVAGIQTTRLWRIYNFGGMRVSEYQKLVSLI